MSARSPFPRGARFEGRRLTAIGGVTVADLAATFGTPLYVLDAAELNGRIEAYRRAFGPQVEVVYAAKALCVVGVLQITAAAGLGVDVASAGELHTASLAGVPPARIVFHGNNKSVAELEMAARLRVGRIVVDSFAELERLSDVGARLGHVFDVLVRVTPGIGAGGHAAIATGQDDSKFGFTLSAGLAHQAVARALATDGVLLRGLHCHIGSQVSDLAAYQQAAALMVEFLASVREREGVALDELNLGGGLGIAYRDNEGPPSLQAYARIVLDTVARESTRHGLDVPALAVEPGRSIVGPAGVTVYTVGARKEVPGVRAWVSVDGGMSDNIRPALYGARPQFVAAGGGRKGAGELRRFTVAGKHCESGDVLATDAQLPAGIREGDLLAVAATGAYTYAMASNYNRLPRPAMVLVDGGEATLLVRRETLDDVVSHDVVLPRVPTATPAG